MGCVGLFGLPLSALNSLTLCCGGAHSVRFSPAHLSPPSSCGRWDYEFASLRSGRVGRNLSGWSLVMECVTGVASRSLARSRAAASYLEVVEWKRVHLLTVRFHFFSEVERQRPTLSLWEQYVTFNSNTILTFCMNHKREWRISKCRNPKHPC